MRATNDFLFETGSVEDNYGYTGPKRSRSTVWGWLRLAVIIIPYILIIVLFGLVASNDGGSNNYDTMLSISGSITASNTIQQGTGVSLSSAGAVQAGAGTSIYLDIAQLLETNPSDLTINPIYSSTYLVSYTQHKSNKTSLSVIVVGPKPNAASVKYTTEGEFAISSIQTLIQETGVFIALAQDVTGEYNTSFSMLGQVNMETYDISFGPREYYSEAQYSPSPRVSRISNLMFAICYYDSAVVRTRVGTIGPGSLQFSYSEPVVFADNSKYSAVFDVVGLSDSMFLLLHYDNSVGTVAAYSGPLNATIAYVKAQEGQNTTVALGRSSVLTTSMLTSNFDSIRVDDNTAVVVYVDTLTNGGITCQVIDVTTIFGGTSNSLSNLGPSNFSVVFGSSWQVSIGQTEVLTNIGLMDLDIAATSNNGQFVVLFADISNGGAMTAVAGKIYSNGEIRRASSNYVISLPSPNVNQYAFWGALASGTTDPNFIQVAILTVNTNYAASAHASLAVWQSLPIPLGVVSGHTKAGDGVVVSGGVVSGLAELVPGKTYATNTMGELVVVDYYGADGSVPYIVDTNTNTIISSDSKVGVAISATDLQIIKF